MDTPPLITYHFIIILCHQLDTRGGMDHLHMKKIGKLIESIKEDRIIFIISHDLEFLHMICDKVLNLENYTKTIKR